MSTASASAWSSSTWTASVVSPLSGSVSVTSAAMPDARIAPSAARSRRLHVEREQDLADIRAVVVDVGCDRVQLAVAPSAAA